MHKKTIIIGIMLVFLSFITAGCMDLIGGDGGTKYAAHPTKVRYTIQYGFNINCVGNGPYQISYDCNIPEVLVGTSSYDVLYTYDYETKNVANNNMISWNISDMNNNNYILGIQADVTAESMMVSDLNGNDALPISEIKESYPGVFEQYTKVQTVDDTVYIDPTDPTMISIAQGILSDSETQNSFIVAKNLFKWLKQETTYETHIINHDLQPAITTYQIKTGDCDDLSVLYISLCRAVEIPARFIRGIIIEINDEAGITNAIPHAWVEVFVGMGIDGWIPVECAGTATDENKLNAEVYQNFALESVEHLRLFEGFGTNESLNVSMAGPVSFYDRANMEISMENFVQVLSYEVLQQNELYISKNGNRRYQ
jgi:hypothetical protein